MVTTIAAQLIASIAYAHVKPSALITRPPMAGPMTIVNVPSPYSSASAPRSWLRSTRFGTIAETATFSSETNAASTAASAYSTAIGGCPIHAATARAAAVSTRPIWSSSSSLRRSTRSAIAPPSKGGGDSGASSTAPRSPTSSAECV